MTLSVAWLRASGDVRELIFAADSRLRSPFVWDACPKILPLPRHDCALCFAGFTSVAYPFMLQIHAAVLQYSRASNRALDITDFKGNILNIINDMRNAMHSFPDPTIPRDDEETYLLFGGYSWRYDSFKLWTLHYDANIDKFTFRPATTWRGVDGERFLAIVGNHVDDAKSKLAGILADKGKKEKEGFDMEPFEMLRDMLRLTAFDEIGGPPQLVKVYKHMKCTPFPIYWPNRQSQNVTIYGRDLLDYEKPETGVLDPDTLEVVSHS